jgi:hypothetical protein
MSGSLPPQTHPAARMPPARVVKAGELLEALAAFDGGDDWGGWSGVDARECCSGP